jgi:hypothetical protein
MDSVVQCEGWIARARAQLSCGMAGRHDCGWRRWVQHHAWHEAITALAALQVLFDVSGSVRPGEVLALMGRFSAESSHPSTCHVLPVMGRINARFTPDIWLPASLQGPVGVERQHCSPSLDLGSRSKSGRTWCIAVVTAAA